MSLELEINKIETSILCDEFDDAEVLDCVDNIEENYNTLEAVKQLLMLMERHPTFYFGSPGSIVHFVETFYKKGYEEELVLSLKRRTTMHTMWMLNRIINAGENKEFYINILKEIATNENYEAEIRERAEYFINLHI